MQRYHAQGMWGGECSRQKEQHVLRPGVRAYPSPCPSPAPPSSPLCLALAQEEGAAEPTVPA